MEEWSGDFCNKIDGTDGMIIFDIKMSLIMPPIANNMLCLPYYRYYLPTLRR